MSSYRSRSNPKLDRWRMPDGVQSASLYYRLMRWGTQVCTAALFGQRVYNRHVEPASGGVVYISNHQSFLDPVLTTNALRRPGNYLARDTLFTPIFGRLITWVNAIPIRRSQADVGALKEAIRRLRHGGTIVIFPEGTRTRDGRIGPFLPGVGALSQRAAEWTVPVLVEGAFEAWPRTQLLPHRSPVHVQYGEPIHRDEARRYPPEEFVEHVRQRLIRMQTELRRRLGRAPLTY